MAVRQEDVDHRVAVDAGAAAQRSDLVPKGDLDGMPRVVGVLHHLGDARLDDEERRRKMPVDRRDGLGGFEAPGPDDDLRRLVVVGERRPLAEELGVERRVEMHAFLSPRRLLEGGDRDAVERPRHHRAPERDDVSRRPVGESGADLAADAFDVPEVDPPAWGARRPHADERQVGLANRRGGALGDAQASRRHRVADQRGEPRLLDRGASLGELAPLHLGDVDPDNPVSVARKTRRRDAPDVPEAENRDVVRPFRLRHVAFSGKRVWKIVRFFSPES